MDSMPVRDTWSDNYNIAANLYQMLKEMKPSEKNFMKED